MGIENSIREFKDECNVLVKKYEDYLPKTLVELAPTVIDWVPTVVGALTGLAALSYFGGLLREQLFGVPQSDDNIMDVNDFLRQFAEALPSDNPEGSRYTVTPVTTIGTAPTGEWVVDNQTLIVAFS